MFFLLYLLVNFIQISGYAAAMLYLAGELSLQKKRLLPTGISFIILYIATIVIQYYDNDWVVVGLFLILSLYFFFIHFNTSKSISQSLNIVVCGYLLETLCQCFFLLLYNVLRIPCDINGYDDPVSLSIVVFGVALLIPVLRLLPAGKWMNSLENISYSTSLILIIILLVLSSISLRYSDVSLGLLMPTLASIAIFTFLGVLIVIQSWSDLRRKQAIRDYETYMPILNDMIQNIQKQHHLYLSLIHI